MGKAFLEVLAGRALLTATARMKGMRTLPPVDKITGNWELPRDRKRLTALVNRAAWVHFDPDCRVWSRAMTNVSLRGAPTQQGRKATSH